MPGLSKDLWKSARSIHGHLVRRQGFSDPAIPASEWQHLEKLSRQLRAARRRDWQYCVPRLRDCLAYAARRLRDQCAELVGDLSATDASVHFASITDIYRDLVALDQEFESVTVNQDECEVRVTTDRIQFDGISLGHFQIRLRFSQGRGAPSYRIVALDANPASTNDAVTHPHVNDETLCEGEGQPAIAAALAAGRLSDFFLLVSQVLHTYSPGSAWVEMSAWYGASCHACGASLDQDDRGECERCEAVCCGECLGSCQNCGQSQCQECLGVCAGCYQSLCNNCLEACDQCGADTCESCLHQGYCPQCQESPECQETSEEQHDGENNQSPPGPALQSAGLGQAAVSA